MGAITQVRPSTLAGGESRRIQGIASDLDDLKIRGESFRATITDAIVDEGVRITRTIDGASTLEIPILDDDGSVRRHPIFQQRCDIEIDGLKFTLVAKDRADDGTFTPTFEAKNVWRLRQHKGNDRGGPAKAYRDKVTRAEFWVDLARMLQPEIPIWCPELHTTQPIESVAQARDDEVERDIQRGKGLDPGANLTVKGVKATPAQISLADTMMRAAVSYGANDEILIGLITAAINESTIKNLTGGLADSSGPLQVQASDHPGLDPRDPVAITKVFVTEGFTGAGSAVELSKRLDVPEWLGKVMWMFNATTYPGNRYIPEARKWVEAFGGGSTGERTVTETKRFPFTVAANEDWWAAGQRLFSEVNWRLFEAADLIYVIAETDLLESRVRMRVREGAPGIDAISWTADTGQRVDEIEVSGRAGDWAAPPGAVAAVEGEGESIDGNYIVSSIDSLVASEDVTVTLKRPTKPLPEPANETTTKTIGGGGGSILASGGPEAFQKMVAEAERIDKLNISYVFGGGHVAGMAPANGPFDCSSAVSRVLQVGGFLDTTLSTGPLNNWGEAGEGELVTVFVRNGGTGGGHTIMKLGARYWGTSGENPGGGPGFITPTSAYVATLPVHRHPQGL